MPNNFRPSPLMAPDPLISQPVEAVTPIESTSLVPIPCIYATSCGIVQDNISFSANIDLIKI